MLYTCLPNLELDFGTWERNTLLGEFYNTNTTNQFFKRLNHRYQRSVDCIIQGCPNGNEKFIRYFLRRQVIHLFNAYHPSMPV